MRRLIIEASDKLARKLELKLSDPDRHEASIRDNHDKRCRK